MYIYICIYRYTYVHIYIYIYVEAILSLTLNWWWGGQIFWYRLLVQTSYLFLAYYCCNDLIPS
jgi:hypothetical protein